MPPRSERKVEVTGLQVVLADNFIGAGATP
jgi:hypothetical protein